MKFANKHIVHQRGCHHGHNNRGDHLSDVEHEVQPQLFKIHYIKHHYIIMKYFDTIYHKRFHFL